MFLGFIISIELIYLASASLETVRSPIQPVIEGSLDRLIAMPVGVGLLERSAGSCPEQFPIVCECTSSVISLITLQMMVFSVVNPGTLVVQEAAILVVIHAVEKELALLENFVVKVRIALRLGEVAVVQVFVILAHIAVITGAVYQMAGNVVLMEVHAIPLLAVSSIFFTGS